MNFIRSFVVYTGKRLEKDGDGSAFQTAVICDTMYHALAG